MGGIAETSAKREVAEAGSHGLTEQGAETGSTEPAGGGRFGDGHCARPALVDERDGGHDSAERVCADGGGPDRPRGRGPVSAEQEEKAKYAEPHGGKPRFVSPGDLFRELAADGERFRSQPVIPHPRPVLRRRGEGGEPGHVAELLFAEEFRKEDEDNILRVGKDGSPCMGFPHWLKPDISGGEVQLPVWIVPLLFATEHDADLHRLVEVDLERARPWVGTYDGMDGGIGCELVVVPRGTQYPVRICARRAVTCSHIGQLYKFLVRLCNDE